MKPLSLLLSACLLCGCASDTQPGAGTAHNVYVTQPVGASDDAAMRFAGVVEEEHSVSLGFKTAGQIERVLVREGDRVAAGQLLAVLDDADYRLGVEALAIQYDQLSDEVERARRLMERKSMSVNDYEKAAAGLRQLGVQLQANRNKLAYTRLYAPAAGVIASVAHAPAEMVDAGTPVFTLLRVNSLEVTCDIPSRAYMDRDRFESFECVAPRGGAPRPLRLLSIVPKADSHQLYRMTLAFEDAPGSAITPGMNVEVTARLSGTPGDSTVLVPASAVFRHGDSQCVWLLQADSTVTRRAVTTDGVPRGADVAVTSGLTADDRVVRAGVSMLHQGERVAVIAAPSATNVGELL